MRSVLNWLQTRWGLTALFIIFISLGLQWFAHPCLLLLSDDSFNYLSAAESFRRTFQFLSPDGSAYTYWPPLFPILLSFFEAPEQALYLMNFFIGASIGIMLAGMARRTLHHFGLRAIYLAIIMCSVHFLMITTFIWSEWIFVLLVLLFLRFLKGSTESSASFVMALVCGFLLCLQRNSGLFIVAGATVWYLTLDGQTWKQKIAKAGGVFLIGSSGFWLWNGYVANYLMEDLKSNDHRFFRSIIHNLDIMAKAVVHAYIPLNAWSIFFLVIFLLAFGIWLWDDFRKDPSLRLFALVMVTYLAGMCCLFRLYPGDGDRYLTVVLPFLLLIFLKAIEKVMLTKTSFIQTLFIVLLICWMTYPMARTIKNAMQWRKASCQLTDEEHLGAGQANFRRHSGL